MNKFLVILSDMQGVPDYMHPTEICGIDKNDVMQVIQENTPRQYIKGIFTPKEYLQYIKTDQFKSALLSFNPHLGNKVQGYVGKISSYVTSMLTEQEKISNVVSNQPPQLPPPTSATSSIPTSNVVPPIQVQQQILQSTPIVQKQQVIPPPIQQQQVVIEKKVKYFRDGNNQFKLENGELYKKIWEDVNLDTYNDQNGEQIYPEIRLINKETGKPMKSSKIGVQKLVWQKLQ